MKKLILILVSILLLIGCSDKITEITTYSEVIKDNKVVFDDISYDVQSVSIDTITYDNNDNRKKVIKYTDGDLYSTSNFDYNGDQLIESKQVNEDGLEYISKYTYEDGIIRVNMVVSDKDIPLISTSYLDKNDRALKTEMMVEGVVISTSIYDYEKDELKKILSFHDGKLNTTQNYEYNNIGDVIVRQTIHHDQDDYLLVEFFDYEYNDNKLPKTITKSWIRSEREGFSITIN